METTPKQNPRKELGIRGEQAAALFLERCGLTILERNWTCKFAEIDIIALEENQLVFCEVKTRKSCKAGTPASAVTPTKQKRYCRAAAFYMQQHPEVGLHIRFDVVAIFVDHDTRAHLTWYKNAFVTEGAL